MKGETIQKLVLFGTMSIGALLVAEGYLRVRAFVDRVEATGKQVAVLKQEVDFLRVQLDVVPRPGVEPLALALAPHAQAQPQPAAQPTFLPIPEPMRFPSGGQDRAIKAVRTNEAAAPEIHDESAKADAIPDDGKIVLMPAVKEQKTAAAPVAPSGSAPAAVATPTVDVKLWPKK